MSIDTNTQFSLLVKNINKKGVKNCFMFDLFLRIFLLCILFVSCSNPIDTKETKLKADAGEDQTTYVGSFAVLDPTKSNLKGETVDVIQWIQDPSNPDEIFAFALSLEEKSYTGFVKEGVYKLTLKIICKSGNIYTDDLVITVKPRQMSLVKDINLEARIRQTLNYKEGNLTSDKLQLLDSLSTYNFPLKNKIINIEGIENCINLRFLALSLQSITDLTPLSNLVYLEFLNLNQNYTIEDISPLYNLIELKKLILYSNPIKDISCLGNLNKLIYLDLLDLPISDISALSNLKNLETLYASGVGIGINFNNIKPLKNLTKLTHLDLAGRGITSIEPLENLTELVLLGISYNELKEISSISKIKKLIRLYIRRNKVEDITGIRNLENLDFLDAADNQIKDISELQYLPNIHLIGLSGNKIEDIYPLVNNPYLGKGVYLYLRNNPLSEKSINEYIPELISRSVTVYWQ